jgi:hypothetical protein
MAGASLPKWAEKFCLLLKTVSDCFLAHAIYQDNRAHCI